MMEGEKEEVEELVRTLRSIFWTAKAFPPELVQAVCAKLKSMSEDAVIYFYSQFHGYFANAAKYFVKED